MSIALRTARSRETRLLRDSLTNHNLSRRCQGPVRRHYATGSDAPTAGKQNPDAYCRDFVKRHDRDAYLTSQFFPKQLQGACFAIRAFYLELAMIQDSVSNPMIGQMRMQFWRDAVKQLPSGSPPKHPIALALHDAARTYHVAPYHLKRIIDAREVELTSPSHLNMDTVLAHAESTASTLNYTLLSILGLASSESLSHAASHLGVAQTLAIWLRALPYHASKGFMVIPASITAKHHCNHEEVFRKGPAAQGIEDAVYDFAVIANDHLITAREMFKHDGSVKVPKEAMPVFLSAVPTQDYLHRLEKSNFNAFEPKLQVRPAFSLPWKIWRSSFNQTF